MGPFCNRVSTRYTFELRMESDGGLYMSVIIELPYLKVSRKMEWNEQQIIETEAHIQLFKDKIVDDSTSFHLREVWDISYKASANFFGWLYLHTNRGLFSYYLKSNPEQFIIKYRDIKNNCPKNMGQ